MAALRERPGQGKTGLLLLNLGTPESPEPRHVRRYLREFLSDPRVLDMPALKRWLILNLFILPFRPRASGRAYASIWTDEGSPLLVHTRALARGVAARFDESVVVEYAMRYGEPSIASAIDRLAARGADRIVAFPLYPQYSSAATGSSVEAVMREAARRWNTPFINVIPPFFDHAGFLAACSDRARPVLRDVEPEVVFFSFHGLPERQVRKSDASGSHCLAQAECCREIVPANRNCYRAQCFETARRLGDLLEIPERRRVVCFQSRLGRDPWIKPYTDLLLVEHAQRGTKRAVIISPAFVADCLETLEELGIRAMETWTENGGERLGVVPCVNADERWIDAVVDIVRAADTKLGVSVRGVPGQTPIRA